MVATACLKDLCEIITKGTTPTALGFDFADNGVGFLRVQNISGGTVNYEQDTLFIDEAVHQSLKRSQILPGDVLLSIAGTIGRTGIVPSDAPPLNCNQAVAILRPTNKVCRPYLRHWLESTGAQSQMRGATVTGTIQNLSLSQTGGLRISLPTLPEQRRIAAILDQADALRTKRREALAQLDSLTQSIFIEMFGDPVTNPMGWEVKKLKEISKSIVNGTTPNGGSQVYVSDGIVFIRSQNVWKNSLLLDDVAFIDNETHFKMRKSSLQNKDILITKTGRINTENSSLGRAAIFIGKDNSANINGHVYLIRLEKGSIHEFVLYILTTDEYREYIRSVCVGGIDKRQINKEHLEEFPIIFPPVDLQHRFATLVESIEKQKGIYRAQLAELDNLFASFQHRAFRGEL